MEYFHCPSCNRKASLLHRVPFAAKEQLYFGCRNDACRCHFQVLRCSGFPDQIVAQSPREVTEQQTRPYILSLAAVMGCPGCGKYGSVKVTYPQRADGKWRRHKCRGKCGYYFTCEDVDGATVHRRMKSKKAIDLFGEAAE
jgi:hypothetical protein